LRSPQALGVTYLPLPQGPLNLRKELKAKTINENRARPEGSGT